MTLSIIRFLNILIAALLAGVSFGIWIGFNPVHLSPSTYLEQQQNMLQALQVLMISLVFIATLITIVSAVLQKNNRFVFSTLLVAAGFFVACILITRFGNKPIDDLVMTWSLDSLPTNWAEVRDSWWSFHRMRTVTELIALILITWSSVKKD
jgi:archaellum biogenesis protein FlaJ (TadC family)